MKDRNADKYLFYLTGEFSMSYRPTSHGRAGLGATSGRFIPLK